MRDRQANLTQRVSLRNDGGQGNGASVKPRISTDGHYVSFRSAATNLVTGDSNLINDIFVRDRQAGTTERVSVGPGGAQSNGDSDASDVSADGRYVTFNSIASNLVAGDSNDDYDVFLRDRLNGLDIDADHRRPASEDSPKLRAANRRSVPMGSSSFSPLWRPI